MKPKRQVWIVGNSLHWFIVDAKTQEAIHATSRPKEDSFPSRKAAEAFAKGQGWIV